MGSMMYDGTTIHFDDRVMAHLQIVVVQKFLKEESFLMSWKGRKSVETAAGPSGCHPASH